MVRLYAKEASDRLATIFEDIAKRPASDADLGDDFGKSAKGALDFFFVDE